MENKDRAHAGRLLIVHDSQQLLIQSDLLGAHQAEIHVVESLLMIDRRHRCVSVDEAFCRLIGVRQEDLTGQTVGLQIGLDAYDKHIRPCIEQAFAGEVAAAMLLTTHEVLGTLSLACVCHPCLGQAGQIEYVLLRVRDDSARTKQRLASQRHKQRRSVLSALDSALGSAAELEKIGALAVHSLLELTGCYAVVLRQTRRANSLPDNAVSTSLKQQVAATFTTDTELKPGEQIVLTLQDQGVTLGELELLLDEGKVLRGELRSFVDAVAKRLTQALFRDMLQAQTQQYIASLEQIVTERTQEVTRRRHAAMGLHDVLGMLISNRPLSVIVDYIMRQAEKILGADAVAILQAQGKDGDITCAPLDIADPYSSVTAADLLGVQNAIAEVVKQRRPLTGHSDNWVSDSDGRYRTHLVVPVIVTNALAGIAAYFFMASHEFTSDEIETAIWLSEQVFFAVESDRLQKRAQEGAALKERERLARELHDTVSQSIFSLSLYTEVGRRQASSGQMERVEESLEQVGETVQQIMKQMQLLLYELRPNVLEQIGLLGALHQRLEAVERSAGIDVTLEVTGHFRLPSVVEEGLYRIAQEALNNALKHSSARKTNVSVRVDGDVVTLEIVDDGVGFAALPEGDENIIGILHMRERAAALNADLAIESAPDEGTRVTVSVLVPGIGGVVNNDNGNTSDHQSVPVDER